MAAVAGPAAEAVIVTFEEGAKFVIEEWPLIQALFSARKAGADRDALFAAIRASLVAVSDADMKQEL